MLLILPKLRINQRSAAWLLLGLYLLFIFSQNSVLGNDSDAENEDHERDHGDEEPQSRSSIDEASKDHDERIKKNPSRNKSKDANEDDASSDCGRVFKLGDTFSRHSNPLTGAYDAKQGFYPSVVEIVIPYSQGDVVRCAGTVLDNMHIATMSACFFVGNATRGLVSTSLKRLSVAEAVNSPYWTVKTCASNLITENNAEEGFDDIVVAKMNKPFVFDKTLQPACLPDSPLPGDREAYVVGQDIELKNEFTDPETLQVIPAKKSECQTDERFKFDAESNWERFCVKSSIYSEFKGSICKAQIGSPLLAFHAGRQTLFGMSMPFETWCLPGFQYAASFADIYTKRDEIKKLLKDCA